MTKLHIIWNPVAGNGAALQAYASVTAALDSAGVPYTAAKSAYPGHAVELARQAVIAGHEKIVALGGDGTMREVAMSVFNTDATMGIIPCGTGNDMARPLGISTDPLTALDVVLHGERRLMDAATANDELFFNVAGFVFDVDVLDYTELYKKKYKNGSFAYLRGLLSAIAGMRSRRTEIVWPDGSKTYNVLMIAAANGTHIGGGMMVAPEADPFDGLLDVCVMHDVTKPALFTLLPRFLRGKHISEKYLTYFRTTELMAVCDPASRIQVDGEVMPGTPVTFRIVPEALWIILPKRA